MADTYTTEAIACGLSDVAGWLENEGGREKHARTIRLGVERLRELGAASGGEGEKQRRDEDGFACEYDPGCKPETDTYTILWDAGARWLIVDRHGLITAGRSPADGQPVQQTTWEALMKPAAPSHTGEADRVGLGDERPLAEQAKHHGRDWAVWWQGSGDRGDHIMEVTQSGLGYARELAWIGDQHHVEAGALVAEHNEQVRRLREVIARQAAAKGLLQAELGRIKAVIPASLTYEVPDAAEAIASTFRQYVKVAAEATALHKSLAAAETGDLVSYLERQWAWSKETFGPALRTKGIVQHITKELREIEAEPHDLAEWVDVIILAMDGFWRHGGRPEDLLPAMQAKQDRNFARTWPDWRTMGEDQAIEHDRSGERLKLKKGAYYRSGEGEIIGPMFQVGGVWYGKGCRGDWTDDGVNLHGFPANSASFGKTDLVAEVEPPALGTEAEGQDAEGGLVHEGPADLSATHSPLPHPQAPNTLSEVEETRGALEGLDEIIREMRIDGNKRGESLIGYHLEKWGKKLRDCLDPALATLRASQEQDGEVRS